MRHRNITLLQVSWSDRLFVVSFMYPVPHREQTTGCIFFFSFQVTKSMWANSQMLRVTQRTNKIRRNHRCWSTRERRGGWLIVRVRYDLVGVLLIVIVSLIIFFPTPNSTVAWFKWSMATFKDDSCTETEHSDVDASEEKGGGVLWILERWKEHWMLVEFHRLPSVPWKVVPNPYRARTGPWGKSKCQ